MIKRIVCIVIILSMLAGHRTSNIFMTDLAIDSGLNTPRTGYDVDNDWDDLFDLSEVGNDHLGGSGA